MALVAVLLVVQMWLLTAALESVLAGHAGHHEAALPGALLIGLLFLACAGLYAFVARLDAEVRNP